MKPRVENQNDIFFQQDRALPHYGLIVRKYFLKKFEGMWIGIEWPSLSPDLTPRRLYFGGVLKNKVYNI